MAMVTNDSAANTLGLPTDKLGAFNASLERITVGLFVIRFLLAAQSQHDDCNPPPAAAGDRSQNDSRDWEWDRRPLTFLPERRGEKLGEGR